VQLWLRLRIVFSIEQDPDGSGQVILQVAQGLDTDCFGELIGSILGAYFGPGHLEDRWLAPFNDQGRIASTRTRLAYFYKQSLSEVAERMRKLPRWVAQGVEFSSNL
jgi:hypothetical protein